MYNHKHGEPSIFSRSIFVFLFIFFLLTFPVLTAPRTIKLTLISACLAYLYHYFESRNQNKEDKKAGEFYNYLDQKVKEGVISANKAEELFKEIEHEAIIREQLDEK